MVILNEEVLINKIIYYQGSQSIRIYEKDIYQKTNIARFGSYIIKILPNKIIIIDNLKNNKFDIPLIGIETIAMTENVYLKNLQISYLNSSEINLLIHVN